MKRILNKILFLVFILLICFSGRIAYAADYSRNCIGCGSAPCTDSGKTCTSDLNCAGTVSKGCSGDPGSCPAAIEHSHVVSSNCSCSYTAKNCNHCCGSSSIVQGTKILMEDGTYQNIENIKEGESIKSFDLKNKKITVSKIDKISKNETKEYLVINKTLKLTKDHLIYLNNKFQEAKNIKKGDILLDENLQEVKVSSVELNNKIGKIYSYFDINFSLSKFLSGITTYDIHLDSTNNFFAGNYLIHNAAGDGCLTSVTCTTNGLCDYDCDDGYTYDSALGRCCQCHTNDTCCDGCMARQDATEIVCRDLDDSGCDVVEKCTASGTCPADAKAENGTYCGFCKICGGEPTAIGGGGICENVATGSDPYNNCDTTGCLTGYCNSNDGGVPFCDYYIFDKHNCDVNSECNEYGECVELGPKVAKGTEDLILIGDMYFGQDTDGKSEVVGTEEGNVIIDGNVQLEEGSYLIYSYLPDKHLKMNPNNPESKIIFSGGAIVRAGTEIKSGPDGPSSPGAGDGKTACICMKDVDKDGYWDATTATGFVPDSTGKKSCNNVLCKAGYRSISDLNDGGDCADGTGSITDAYGNLVPMANIHPGAEEILCNGILDDCGLMINEDGTLKINEDGTISPSNETIDTASADKRGGDSAWTTADGLSDCSSYYNSVGSYAYQSGSTCYHRKNIDSSDCCKPGGGVIQTTEADTYCPLQPNGTVQLHCDQCHVFNVACSANTTSCSYADDGYSCYYTGGEGAQQAMKDFYIASIPTGLCNAGVCEPNEGSSIPPGDPGTTTEGVVLNSASGKNCNTICADNGYNGCLSIGMDGNGTDGNFQDREDSEYPVNCVVHAGDCSTYMDGKWFGGDPDNCGTAHQAMWTNCRCIKNN